MQGTYNVQSTYNDSNYNDALSYDSILLKESKCNCHFESLSASIDFNKIITVSIYSNQNENVLLCK